MPVPRGLRRSNLDCFLDCTTPIVPSKLLHKTSMRNVNRLWHPWERESIEYFTLEGLWGCYDEWSAYGAGTPIVLSTGQSVVQYYVPYLSAIQVYTGTRSLAGVRSLREDNGVGDSGIRDSVGESCSHESESGRLSRWNSGLYEHCGLEQENLLNSSDRLGNLYFQYFEKSTPYGRLPFVDKITGLARSFPGLMTLKSIDLSPASWMAVSWYPIYHIPMGRTVKDLSACFLTYHTLSSSFLEIEPGSDKSREKEGLALPPFGLATYKMHGNVWVSSDSNRDQERLLSMLSAANSWLKQLNVHHHDFNYFTGIRRG